MDFQTLLPYFISLIPAIIVGVIAYLFFKKHTENEESRRNFLISKEAQATSLPLRLQAFERIALFLERIDPNSLLIRVKPRDSNLSNYETELINSIEKEFEHNLTQQIYLSAESWNAVKTSKNATIQLIRQTSMNEKVETSDKLREAILNHFMGNITPSQKALTLIKAEIVKLF
ncbi:hypothetical protein [Patiriisocius marinus]|uniref:Uncharacterized protein n=1 Tax=Patiriisocius marinus TaxID=1397112 RepID=A0A5J4ISP1_9FLAO|nr:hypothetical protein [Patiriisocius marinus]GER61015.1 hypothetical protein ULMA_31230 [Patiriisocius marinus]